MAAGRPAACSCRLLLAVALSNLLAVLLLLKLRASLPAPLAVACPSRRRGRNLL